jgi:hypothetical protein
MNPELLVALISFAALVVVWAFAPSRGIEAPKEVKAPAAHRATV